MKLPCLHGKVPPVALASFNGDIFPATLFFLFYNRHELARANVYIRLNKDSLVKIGLKQEVG